MFTADLIEKYRVLYAGHTTKLQRPLQKIHAHLIVIYFKQEGFRITNKLLIRVRNCGIID